MKLQSLQGSPPLGANQLARRLEVKLRSNLAETHLKIHKIWHCLLTLLFLMNSVEF
jgi:hypothetical protein